MKKTVAAAALLLPLLFGTAGCGAETLTQPCQEREIVSLTTSLDGVIAVMKSQGWECYLASIRDVPIPVGTQVTIILQEFTYECELCEG